MNKRNKIVSLLLLATLAFVPQVCLTAAEDNQKIGSFTGKVTDIRSFLDEKGEEVSDKSFILLENEEGTTEMFLVNSSTQIIMEDDETLEKDSIVTGIYDMSKPQKAIYPPQHDALAMLVTKEDNEFVKVGRFGENHISTDNKLQIEISDKTKIVAPKGESYNESFYNKDVIVIYSYTTKSIPPQTSPTKIIVLDKLLEDTAPSAAPTETFSPMATFVPTHTLPPTDTTTTLNVPKGIVYNGKEIDTPEMFKNTSGKIMVPLRAIATAMNLDVTWKEATKEIVLDGNIFIQTGRDSYSKGYDDTEMQLGTAPEIVNGRTYVPIEFFTKVMKMDNIFISRNKLIIETMIPALTIQ